jgi:hypothetical protein
MRLVAAPGIGAGELDEATGKRTRLVDAAGQEQSLTQFSEHEGMEEYRDPGGNPLKHLVQERYGLGSSPGQGIRRTQDGSSDGEDEDVGGLGERQSLFEYGDRCVHVSFAVGNQTSKPQRIDTY